jgi:hypothetical protein
MAALAGKPAAKLMEVKVLMFSDQYFVHISHFLHVCCIFCHLTLLYLIVLTIINEDHKL